MGITKVDINTMDDITYSILDRRLFEEEEGVHGLLDTYYPMYRIRYEYILKLIRESEQVLYDLLVEAEHHSVDYDIAKITGDDKKLEELEGGFVGEELDNEMFRYEELKGLLREVVSEVKKGKGIEEVSLFL